MRAPRGEPALEESLERYQRRLRGELAAGRGPAAFFPPAALPSASARLRGRTPLYPAVPCPAERLLLGLCGAGGAGAGPSRRSPEPPG